MDVPPYVWVLLWIAVLGISGTVIFFRKNVHWYLETLRLQQVVKNQEASLRSLQLQIDSRAIHLLRDDVHLYATNINFSEPLAYVVINTHNLSEAWLQEAYARFRDRVDRVRHRTDKPDSEIPVPVGPRTRTVQLGG